MLFYFHFWFSIVVAAAAAAFVVCFAAFAYLEKIAALVGQVTSVAAFFACCSQRILVSVSQLKVHFVVCQICFALTSPVVSVVH